MAADGRVRVLAGRAGEHALAVARPRRAGRPVRRAAGRAAAARRRRRAAAAPQVSGYRCAPTTAYVTSDTLAASPA